MEHLRQIEEDLRNIYIESRKRFPEVADAAEQAVDSLKAVREVYINDLRRQEASSDLRLPQAADLVSPYILVCNHANCHPKLIGMALNSLSSLLSYEVVPVQEAQNILRVLLIQVPTATKNDFQLKLIQLCLQLATLMARDKASLCLVSEQAMVSLLTILFSFADPRQTISIASAASGTTRQIVSLMMDRACMVLESYHREKKEANNRSQEDEEEDLPACCLASIFTMIRELAFALQGTSSILRLKDLPATQGGSAMKIQVVEVLQEVLAGRDIFFAPPSNLLFLQSTVLPAVKTLLKNLKYDYIFSYGRAGQAAASVATAKSLRLTISILKHFAQSPPWLDDFSALLADGVQPVRDFNHKDIELKTVSQTKLARSSSSSSSTSSAPLEMNGVDVLRSKLEEASTLLISGGVLLSKLATGAQASGSSAKALPSHDKQAFVLLSSSSGARNVSPLDRPVFLKASSRGDGVIAVYPAACSLAGLVTISFQTLCAGETKPLAHLFSSCSDLILCYLSCPHVDFKELEQAIRHSGISATLRPFIDEGELKVLFNSTNQDEAWLAMANSPNVPTTNTKALHGEQSCPSSFVDTLCEYIYTHQTAINSSELFLIVLYCLQFAMNMTLRLGFFTRYHQSDTFDGSPNGPHDLFLAPSAREVWQRVAALAPDTVCHFPSRQALADLLMQSYEGVLEACAGLIKACETLPLLQSCSSVLCEIPLWHGSELLEGQQPHSLQRQSSTEGSQKDEKNGSSQQGESSNATSSTTAASPYLWKHSHLLRRLLLLLHLVADTVTDWDCIVDCLEQVSLLVAQQSEENGPQLMYPRKVLQVALRRFLDYSLYLSQDSLLRLMTSFVALSMNNLTLFSSSSSLRTVPLSPANSNTVGVSSSSTGGTNSLSSPSVPYSIEAVVTISKRNAFRITTLWQMTSRQQEVGVEAAFEVLAAFLSSSALPQAALLDTLLKTVMLTDDEGPFAIYPDLSSAAHVPSSPKQQIRAEGEIKAGHKDNAVSTSLLLDIPLLEALLPSLDSVFFSRAFYRNQVEKVLEEVASDPQLSQADLLGCLPSLCALRSGGGSGEEVRLAVLRGLANFLPSAGPLLSADPQLGGWLVVLRLLATVPLAFTGQVVRLEWATLYPSNSDGLGGGNNGEAQEEEWPSWPREALSEAFSSVSLIAAELLDGICEHFLALEALLHLLALFGAQTADTNMALVAVETLWKVADAAIAMVVTPSAPVTLPSTPAAVTSAPVSPRRQRCAPFTVDAVTGVVLDRLCALALDGRPEVRHSATNSLFSALSTNAARLSSSQWQRTFDEVLQPLFEKSTARCLLAIKINEQAVAPEVKRGVRMAVHHSRDSAYKQWTESRALGLRGLARALRPVLTLLPQRPDLLKIVCHRSARMARVAALAQLEGGAEASLAALELLLLLLRGLADLCPQLTILPTIDEPNPEEVYLTSELWWSGSWRSRKFMDRDAITYCKVVDPVWHELSLFALASYPSPDIRIDLVNRLESLYLLARGNQWLDSLLSTLSLLFYRQVVKDTPPSKMQLSLEESLKGLLRKISEDLLTSSTSTSSSCSMVLFVRHLTSMVFSDSRCIEISSDPVEVEVVEVVGPLAEEASVHLASAFRSSLSSSCTCSLVLLKQLFRMKFRPFFASHISDRSGSEIIQRVDSFTSEQELVGKMVPRLCYDSNTNANQTLLSALRIVVDQLTLEKSSGEITPVSRTKGTEGEDRVKSSSCDQAQNDGMDDAISLTVATLVSILSLLCEGGSQVEEGKHFLLQEVTALLTRLLRPSSLAVKERERVLHMLWVALSLRLNSLNVAREEWCLRNFKTLDFVLSTAMDLLDAAKEEESLIEM
eukprot:scaffold1931_cov215-Ochromonas_danica.AAC.17